MSEIAYKNKLASIENPYIKYGLVGMWDGIWNIGVGKHDNETDVWKDLAGNNDAVKYGQYVYFDDDCLVSENGDSCFIANPDPLMSGQFTIELIHTTIAVGANQAVIAFRNTGSAWRGIAAQQWGGNLQFVENLYSSENIGPDFKSCALVVIPDDKLKHKRTFICTDLYTKQIVDMTEVSYGQRSTSKFNLLDLRFGHDGTNSVSNIKSEIFCIRIYNRVLTDEEIEFNNEIDVRRFGI